MNPEEDFTRIARIQLLSCATWKISIRQSFPQLCQILRHGMKSNLIKGMVFEKETVIFTQPPYVIGKE